VLMRLVSSATHERRNALSLIAPYVL